MTGTATAEASQPGIWPSAGAAAAAGLAIVLLALALSIDFPKTALGFKGASHVHVGRMIEPGQ